MMGLYASYPVARDVTLSGGIIDGYWHLAHPNDQPSYLAQVSWNVSPRLRLTETLYYSPD
jgi:hypothetical protein